MGVATPRPIAAIWSPAHTSIRPTSFAPACCMAKLLRAASFGLEFQACEAEIR